MSTVHPESPTRRVAFVVTSLRGGGAEAVGVAWISWFAQAGFEVHTIMVSDKPTDLVPESVAVHPLGHLGHAAKVKALRRLVQQEGYEALVAVQTYPNLLALAAVRGLPSSGPSARPVVVVTEHNLISLGLPGASLMHRAKIALAQRTYKYADVVTSCSHPVAAEMSAAFGVPASRSLIVPNPALAKMTSRTHVARTPGTANGIQLVLACRLVEQKSPHLALETAAELQRRGIPTDVVSFGGGPLQDELVAEARRLGVSFTPHGWVEDWFAHFASNSVVLLPSYREGLGNVLIEAAARGVPSVAVSTALGVADAIIPGVTGELAVSGHPEAIADAVEAAASLEVDGVDDWLDRFTASASGAMLAEAIAYAAARR